MRLHLQQGFVDQAKNFLESEQGQKFEQGLQQQFMGNKQNAGSAGQSSSYDSSDPSAGSYGNNDDSSYNGSGGQGDDSNSGMNSSMRNSMTENAVLWLRRASSSAPVSLQPEQYETSLRGRRFAG